MCNCHSESQKNLVEHITKQLPAGATGLNVELKGYVFGLGGPGGITHRAACPVEVTYQAPKKTSGMKTVKQTISLRATFCPFCGEKYDKETDADKTAEELMREHRIAVTPEHEGQWHADLYGHEAEPLIRAEGDTPELAVRAAVALLRESQATQEQAQ